MSQSMNCWPSSFFTCGCLAGFTSMASYWLNSSLSPSTAMTRSDLFLSESHVPRSDSTPGGCCHVERGTHALSDRFVPRPFLLLDVDAGGMPEIDFRNMRTGPVAA